MKKAQWLFSMVFSGLCCGALLAWMRSDAFHPDSSVAAALVCLGLFWWLGLRCIQVFVCRCARSVADASPAMPRPHATVLLLAVAVLSRIVLFIVALALANAAGAPCSILQLFVRGDAPHYLGLAENGYVAVGDARFHLVFFPLFPLLIRLFHYLIADWTAAALVVSLCCFAGSGVALYALARYDLDEPAAFRAALMPALLPAAFFFAAPMTESLFFLLSILTALAARRRQFILAGIFGALGAFCRAPGFLLCILILLEGIPVVCDAGRTRQHFAKQATKILVGTALPGCGLLAYLWLNVAVSGNAFQFLLYQKVHWGQQPGLFFSTAAYQLRYALGAAQKGSDAMLIGVWLPGLLCIFGTLFLLLLYGKQLPPAQLGYALCAFAATIGATWLLSAPRYLLVLFVLCPALGAIPQRRVRVGWYGLFAAAQVGYLFLYVAGYPVVSSQVKCTLFRQQMHTFSAPVF